MKAVTSVAIAGWSVLLLCASTAVAQQPSSPLPRYRARIVGVYDADSGDPITGAEVRDLKTNTSAITTATGTVSLVYLPDGGSLVRIRKVGYTPVALFVSISPDDTVPVTVILSPLVTTLPAVVTKDSAHHYISPGLQAFEERRREGFGHFITEEELRKSDNREMSDVLRHLSGVAVTCSTRTPRKCVALSTRGGCGAYLIYINGVRSTDNNLLMLPVDQFAGVEAYASGATAPAQYNATAAGCGVLLFWYRER